MYHNILSNGFTVAAHHRKSCNYVFFDLWNYDLIGE